MLRRLCALVCLLLAAVTAADAERLPIRIYTVEDGLAHARVRRIVRDSRGFLWFCTIDGLSRFDGTEFVTYRTADGLPIRGSPTCSRLEMARTGSQRTAESPGSTSVGVSHETAGARRRLRDGCSVLCHSRGRRHNVTSASCWKIEPVASGLAGGVVSSYWTEGARCPLCGPSFRVPRRWSPHS
jgi:hypothetical protein